MNKYTFKRNFSTIVIEAENEEIANIIYEEMYENIDIDSGDDEDECNN